MWPDHDSETKLMISRESPSDHLNSPKLVCSSRLLSKYPPQSVLRSGKITKCWVDSHSVMKVSPSFWLY